VVEQSGSNKECKGIFVFLHFFSKPNSEITKSLTVNMAGIKTAFPNQCFKLQITCIDSHIASQEVQKGHLAVSEARLEA